MNILAPTDGSERSSQALPHAARLARAAGAKVRCVRILDKRLDLANELDPSLSEAEKRVASRWRAEMEAICTTIDAESSCAVETKGRNEQVHDALLRVAREEDARAIVMGTRGSGAVRRALLGSVAMSVLGHATVPVVVTGGQVKPPRDGEPYHLVITSDGSEASEAVLPAVAALFKEAKRKDVRFTLLRIQPAEGDEHADDVAQVNAEWQLTRFRNQLPARFDVQPLVRMIPALGGIDSAILAAAEELGADSIWMASHGESLRRHVLAGSTALGVVSRAAIPVGLVSAVQTRKK